MIGTRRQHTSAQEHATELRQLRLKANLSQVALAEVLGVTRRTICRWESGCGTMHKIYLQRIRTLVQTPVEVASDAQQ